MSDKIHLSHSFCENLTNLGLTRQLLELALEAPASAQVLEPFEPFQPTKSCRGWAKVDFAGIKRFPHLMVFVYSSIFGDLRLWVGPRIDIFSPRETSSL